MLILRKLSSKSKTKTNQFEHNWTQLCSPVITYLHQARNLHSGSFMPKTCYLGKIKPIISHLNLNKPFLTYSIDFLKYATAQIRMRRHRITAPQPAMVQIVTPLAAPSSSFRTFILASFCSMKLPRKSLNCDEYLKNSAVNITAPVRATIINLNA